MTPSSLLTSTGCGCISTSVMSVTLTTPEGFVDTTASFISPSGDMSMKSRSSSSNRLPVDICCLIPDTIMSPFTSTLLRNADFISPLIMICCSTGASTTFSASFTSALLTVTSSPMDARAFLRRYPSILMIPRPMSDCDDAAVAAVSFFPSISMMSPSLMPSSSIAWGSSRAIPLPTSACDNASATLSFISFFSILVHLILSYYFFVIY